jgi:hypothetical protein
MKTSVLEVFKGTGTDVYLILSPPPFGPPKIGTGGSLKIQRNAQHSSLLG